MHKKKPKRTHCRRGHPYDKFSVFYGKIKERFCKQCRLDWVRLNQSWVCSDCGWTANEARKNSFIKKRIKRSPFAWSSKAPSVSI